jgi:hypothetical protein
MWAMRFAVVAALLTACSSSPAPTDLGAADMTTAAIAGDLAQGTSPFSPPAGFGVACTQSGDCRGFAQDQPPGFLGCESYIGVDYCTRPCSPAAPCWMGTSCACVMRTNVSGFSETDCYCAKP